jgi:hypothetical protein
MDHRSYPNRDVADQSIIQPATETVAGAPSRAGTIVFVVAACLVCLVYTLYTKQTWEDSLITLRHCENLLNGNGLTYNPGEKVHGFTSPINVLLLTLCHFVTGGSSYVATFWLYRVFTIAAFAASGVLLLKTINDTPPRWSAAKWFLGIFYLFDVKTVAFSVNGMETGFMLLFVAWAVYLLSRSNADQWLWRGLCWGGLMWTRPDGCVYIVAFALAELIFLCTSRRVTVVSLAKSAAVCLTVFGPWLAWAWSYYGSPIPHTIIAKTNLELGPLNQLVAAMDSYVAVLITMAAQAFRPIYYAEQTHWLGDEIFERILSGSTVFVGLVALLYFIYPARDRFGRAMSFCFAFVCSYFTYMTIVYPWYYPAATLLGATAFTRCATFFALTSNAQDQPRCGWPVRKVVALVALVVLAAGAMLLFGPAALEQRVHQAEIEMGNRALIGKWLKENGSITERVYLEPLGYIGYFSGMQMNDYPGLVSPEVVRIRHQLSKDKQSIQMARLLVIPELKPEWVVLRFGEFQAMTRLPMFEAFKKDYTFMREFSVHKKLDDSGYVPGIVGMRYDAGFVVFRRNSIASAPADN